MDLELILDCTKFYYVILEVIIISTNNIREPIQKRSIEKKQKIIKSGFDLICQKGYYNTNTAEIAKAAGVSTGIVYQYFKDKHDILIEGIKLYAGDVIYPVANKFPTQVSKENIKSVLKEVINQFVENHKLSKVAHEEIMSMTHSDKEIANFYREREMYTTKVISDILIKNGFDKTNLEETVHISLNLIDDLCHEVVYHKHNELNYEVMINLVIDTISNLLIHKQ